MLQVIAVIMTNSKKIFTMLLKMKMTKFTTSFRETRQHCKYCPSSQKHKHSRTQKKRSTKFRPTTLFRLQAWKRIRISKSRSWRGRRCFQPWQQETRLAPKSSKIGLDSDLLRNAKSISVYHTPSVTVSPRTPSTTRRSSSTAVLWFAGLFTTCETNSVSDWGLGINLISTIRYQSSCNSMKWGRVT